MADEAWDVPQTEEGLQTILGRLAERRAQGDESSAARGLLRLSHLVKWVRSDNEEAPFDRSRTLALEALAIFRRLGDTHGQVHALHAAAPFVPPGEKARMLAEADRLALGLGNEVLAARSLVAQSRALGITDPAAAVGLGAVCKRL